MTDSEFFHILRQYEKGLHLEIDELRKRVEAIEKNDAPDLLEACRGLVANLKGSKEFAKDAIAKATEEK